MENSICPGCHKLKASFQCGLCQTALCKRCAHFLEESSFSFMAEVPPDLSHSAYCDSCFNATVAPQLESYNHTLERAKDVQVYNKSQGKETRLIKRLEKPVHVHDCRDHDESILRLAFFAAERDFNALVDVQITSAKIRNGSYQTTRWSAVGIPAMMDENKRVRDRSIWQNPN